MNKAELQERALDLELEIRHEPEQDQDHGKELTVAELKEAIGTAEEALEVSNAAEESAKDEARASATETPTEATEGHISDADGSVSAANTEAAPSPSPTAGRKRLSDAAMAKKHGYPVTVPGGKPYKTRVSFNCSAGGGLRPADSVVLLNDREAEHKAEFITAVK